MRISVAYQCSVLVHDRMLSRRLSTSPHVAIHATALRSHRARDLKTWVVKALRLDVPRLTPLTAAAVYQFRTARGRTPPLGASPDVLPIAVGDMTDLHIRHVFPHTVCWVQVDLEAFAIRWAQDRFISLHTVRDVKVSIRESSMASLVKRLRLRKFSSGGSLLQRTSQYLEGGARQRVSRLFNRGSSASLQARDSHVNVRSFLERSSSAQSVDPRGSVTAKVDGQNSNCSTGGGSDSTLQASLAMSRNRMKQGRRPSQVLTDVLQPKQILEIHFTDRGGTRRVLELRMSADKKNRWQKGLRTLLVIVPRTASPAHC
eukprot:7384406-Prymnesium_polylepis.1